MDFIDPSLEFAALAAALGMQGHRVETPAAFKAAYVEDVVASKPTLIGSRGGRQRVTERTPSGESLIASSVNA